MNQFYQPSFESCKKNPNREGCCTFENGQCLFVSGQPNRRDTKGKSCMFLSTQESKVGFNDARCTRKNFPICKRQAEGAVTEPAPTLNDTVTASSTTPATTVPPTTAVDDSNWFSLNPVFLSSTTVSAPGSIANFGRSIFVADNDEYKILKFQLMEDGTLSFVRKWGGVGNTNGLFSSVGELAVSPDGERLYAVDTNNQRVQVFDTTGKFLFTFGSFGEGEGQFMSPRGLAISKKANAAGYVVTVTDAALNSIQQFDAEGNFLLRWTDNLNTPSSASFSGDGTLYVADARNNRVTAYHRLNNKVRLLAYGTLGSNNGQFNYPSSLAVATNGMTVVADTFNNRVQIFSPRGQFVSTFGVGGANNGDLLNPLSVAISNSFIIVANTMNNRVDVFGEVTTVSP